MVIRVLRRRGERVARRDRMCIVQFEFCVRGKYNEFYHGSIERKFDVMKCVYVLILGATLLDAGGSEICWKYCI